MLPPGHRAGGQHDEERGNRRGMIPQSSRRKFAFPSVEPALTVKANRLARAELPIENWTPSTGSLDGVRWNRARI